MTMDVDPTAWHRVSQVALEAARGDERTALALLQGCYVELASRLVVTEHASASWLDAISMFCQVASDRLSDEASYFVGATRSTESDRLAKLAGAHEEATRIATQLRARFETFEHTRTPSIVDSATDEQAAAYADHA
jgi:hypothetical protein